MTTTVSDDRTVLDDCDVDDWTGTDGLDTSEPTPAEASGCLGLVVSTETQEAYDTITSDDWSEGGTFSFWGRAYGAMDDTVTGGIQGVIGDGTDRNGYHVGGSDKTGFRHFDGPVEWANFVLDPANLPTDVTNFAGVEANLTLTAVTQIGMAFKTLAKSVGGSRNCHIDICRWADLGVGLEFTGGTTSGAAGNMDEAAVLDRAITDGGALGAVHELAAGVYGIQANIILGDSTSASDQFWTEANFTYAWEDRGFSDRNYYQFKLIGSSTATNCEFSFSAGSFVVPSAAAARFDGNGADITVCNIGGCTFSGFNVGIVSSDDTGDDWTNCTYIDCGAVEAKGCDLTGGAFSGTVECALVEAQDETSYDDTATEGSFDAGASYAATDTITLSGGQTITVDTVSGGAVTEFTVTTSEGYPAHEGQDLTQSSTSGSGTGFKLWPRSANLAEGGSIFYDLAVDPDGELDNLTFTKGTDDTHAVVFGPNIPTSITLRNCDFNTYSSSDNNPASVFHFLDTTGTITVTLVDCTNSGSGFTYKTEGATIDVVTGTVTVKVTAVTDTGVAIENARAHLRASDGTGPLPYGDAVTITRSGTLATVAHTTHGLETNDKVYLRGITDKIADNGVQQVTVTTVNAYTFATADSGSTSYTGDGFIINAQDETSYTASFSGGTGHVVSDVLTLRGGTKITVDAVSGGVVTQFTVDSGDSVGGRSASDVQDQIGSTGSGIDFSITLVGGNIVTEIRSTYVALDGDTDGSGEISISRVFGSNQPVSGWARKSTSAPYYKEGSISGQTISSSTGLDFTAVMVSDE